MAKLTKTEVTAVAGKIKRSIDKKVNKINLDIKINDEKVFYATAVGKAYKMLKDDTETNCLVDTGYSSKALIYPSDKVYGPQLSEIEEAVVIGQIGETSITLLMENLIKEFSENLK